MPSHIESKDHRDAYQANHRIAKSQAQNSKPTRDILRDTNLRNMWPGAAGCRVVVANLRRDYPAERR